MSGAKRKSALHDFLERIVVARLTNDVECGDGNGSHPLTRNWITRSPFEIAMILRRKSIR